MTTVKTLFTPNGTPYTAYNDCDNRDDYYVSYNNYDTEIYGCDTTAIVGGERENFLILNGDHRDAYRGLSFEDACKYFHDNVSLKNKRSDDHQDTDIFAKYRDENGKIKFD